MRSLTYKVIFMYCDRPPRSLQPPPPAVHYERATALLNENDVEAWIANNYPQIASELRRESVKIEEQRRAEIAADYNPRSRKLHCNYNGELVNAGIETSQGIDPYSGHWAFALFPGCGSYEICKLAAKVLTRQEANALALCFGAGLRAEEAALRMNKSRSAVYRFLHAARKKLFKAKQMNALPSHQDEPDASEDWLELMGVHYNKKPPLSARYHIKGTTRPFICSCGRHMILTKYFLDHRKVDPASPKARTGGSSGVVRERYLKCPCGKSYPESQWESIRA